MKKGDLVRLNKGVCFTRDSGGTRRYPMSTSSADSQMIVYASRHVTSDERRVWYESEDSKGIDCAGEPKLPPQSTQVALHADRKYIVERARCRVQLGYSNPEPGMAKVLCTKSGESVYVKRDLLEVIE